MDKSSRPESDLGLIDRRTIIMGLAAAGVGSLVSCGEESKPLPTCEIDRNNTHMRETLISPETNLITAGNWNVSGATLTSAGIELAAIGAAIEDRESGHYQPDYPLNLFGTHLKIPSECSFEVAIHQADGVAFQLYGRPPLIRDDYRIDHGSVRAQFVGDSLVVQTWHGDKEPAMQHVLPLAARADRKLVLHRQSGQTIIEVDGKQLSALQFDPFADTNTAWFGFDTERDGMIESIKVSSTEPVTAVDTTTIEIPKRSDGLQQIANRKGLGLKIGAAVAPGPLVSDPAYASLALGGEFGIWTLENEMKPIHVMPRKGVLATQHADQMIEIAKRHDIEIHGHTLVFARSLPGWIREMSTQTDADKLKVRNVMEFYIGATMAHFGDNLVSCDVVNEPIIDFNGGAPAWRRNIWYEAMGEEYIEIALRAARSVSPNCKFRINENAIENDKDRPKKERWDFLMQMAVPLHEKGLLDGIGMQGHVYELPRDIVRGSTVADHLAELAQHGMSGAVSELDVSVDDEKAKAKQFGEALEPCIQADNCDSLTIWGVMSGYGNNGLPWDAGGCATRGVAEMRKALENA